MPSTRGSLNLCSRRSVMNERRLATETRKALLILSDGRKLEGELFLQLFSPLHGGAQRVSELLNGDENFVPLRNGQAVQLINLAQVVSVQVEREVELDPLLLLGEHHQVKVETVLGHPFEAEIYVNLPGSRNRVKDFLNRDKRFIACLIPGQVLYLNPRFLLSVEG